MVSGKFLNYAAACFVLTMGSGLMVTSAFCQEQVYKYGHIVREDERTEAWDFSESGSIQEPADGDKLPWNPFLSPWMICLDCWITKAIEIKDHYGQQAAERYFKHAETCADEVYLGYDPKGTGMKYFLLSPFYAGCPSLLENGGFWGWVKSKCGYGAVGGPAANYGFTGPIPALATESPEGPRLMAPKPETAAPQVSEPVPSSPAASGSAKAHETTVQTADASGGSRWAQMTDEEILAYFGLGSQVASGPELGRALEAPVEPTHDWEFAEEARVKPAGVLLAQGNPGQKTREPGGEGVVARSAGEETPQVRTTREDVSTGSEIEELRQVLKAQEKEKPFSVTDPEYERLKEIGDSLLDTSF